MPSEAEIERMVVRIVGDGASLQKAIKQVMLETKGLERVEKELTKTEKNRARQMQAAKNVTRSVMTSTERYHHEVKKLEVMLRRGDIGQRTFTRAVRQAKTEYKAAGNAATQMGRSLQRTGSMMTVGVTLPLVGIGVAAIKMGSDLESAFVGVEKTVDGSQQQLTMLRSNLEDMGTVGGVALDLEEIFKIGEVGGQLGVGINDVEEFTKVAADMGVSTNLSSEMAGTSLARISNIAGLTADSFANLGSSIVALGNTTATTESEIVSMTLRLTGAGTQVGMSIDQITALSATLSSVGIEAEAGGTAFSQLMLKIQTEIATGGKKLKAFAAVAGQSTDEFSESFRKDAMGAIRDLLKGIGDLDNEDGTLALKAMGIEGVRMKDALLRTSGAVDLLDKSLKTSQSAYEKGTALAEEAEKRYQSFGSQLTTLKNEVKLAAGEIFVAMEPALRMLIDLAKSVFRGFAELPEPFQQVVVALGAVAAAIGPLIALAGTLTVAFGFLSIAFPALTAGALASAAALVVLKIAIAGLAAAALIAVFLELARAHQQWNEEIRRGVALSGELEESMKKINTKLIMEADPEELKDLEKQFTSTANRMTNEAAKIQTRLNKLTNNGQSMIFTEDHSAVKQLQAEIDELINKAKIFRDSANMATAKKEGKDIGKVGVEADIDKAEEELDKIKEMSEELKAILKPETDLEQLDEMISSMQEKIDAFSKTPIELAIAKLEIEDPESPEAKAKIKQLIELEAELNQSSINDKTKKLTESFKEQEATLGMTTEETSIYKMEMEGADPKLIEQAREQLASLSESEELQSAKKEGEALTQKLKTPREKFQDEQIRLEGLLEVEAIDDETFKRAMQEARDELEETQKEADKGVQVEYGVAGVQAVETGSADFVARMMEHQDMLDNMQKLANETDKETKNQELPEPEISKRRQLVQKRLDPLGIGKALNRPTLTEDAFQQQQEVQPQLTEFTGLPTIDDLPDLSFTGVGEALDIKPLEKPLERQLSVMEDNVPNELPTLTQSVDTDAAIETNPNTLTENISRINSNLELALDFTKPELDPIDNQGSTETDVDVQILEALSIIAENTTPSDDEVTLVSSGLQR